MKRKSNLKKSNFNSSNRCHCRSDKEFEHCCSPILTGYSLADTPEMLMRSRYTAFVLQNSAYLLATWDYRFRPKTLSFESNVQWLNLNILEALLPPGQATEGRVSFAASFVRKSMLFEMKETSIFVRRDGNWYYQEGDPASSEKKLSINSPCPCGSGRKFKRCCLLLKER